MVKFFFFFNFVLLVWVDMSTEKDFIMELVTSGIDLLQTSMKYLLQYILNNCFIKHAFQTTNWVMFSDEKYAKCSCRQEHLFIPSLLPWNQINFECLPSQIILGDWNLRPFWKTISAILTWNGEKKRWVAEQYLGWTVLPF